MDCMIPHEVTVSSMMTNNRDGLDVTKAATKKRLKKKINVVTNTRYIMSH